MSTDQIEGQVSTPLYARVAGEEITIGTIQGLYRDGDVKVTKADIAEALRQAAEQQQLLADQEARHDRWQRVCNRLISLGETSDADQTRTHTTPLYSRVGDTEITIGTLWVDAGKEPVKITRAEVTHPDIADALSTATAQHRPTGELPQLQVLYLPEHTADKVTHYPFALVASGVPAESAPYMRKLLQPFAEQIGAVAVLVSPEPLEVI